MKCNTKKGFTIIELVIVIAVIGILAAILIPTFINLNNKANRASDQSLMNNLNTALKMQEAEPGDTKNNTLHDAVKDLENQGYILGQITTKSEEKLLWNSETNQFEFEENQVGPKFWKIFDAAPASGNTYSVYVRNSWAESIIVDSVGFDVGYSADIKSVHYVNTIGSERTVNIRTDSDATSLEITGYVNPSDNRLGDVVNHYGLTGALKVVKCATGSYHENGKVGFAEINTGRIVLEQQSDIEHIHINKKENTNVFDEVVIKDNGTQKLPASITRDEVSVAAEASVDVVKVITSAGSEEMVKVYGSSATGSTQKTQTQNTGVNSDLGVLVLDNGANSDKALNGDEKAEAKDEYAAEATNAETDYGNSVARIGTQGYATLQAAINAANPDNVVVLLQDLELSTNITLDSAKYAVTITKSLILNGAGHTITARTDRVIGVKGASNNRTNVVIKNITLLASDHSGAQVIMVRDYVDSVTLENVVADNTAAKSGYVQAFTLGGNDPTKRSIVIKNSVIKNRPSSYYAVILWQPVDLEVYDSEIVGWADFYFKPGTTGSTLLVERSKLSSTGITGATNGFGLIDFEESGIPVQIKDSDITVTSATQNPAPEAIVVFSPWSGPNTGSSVAITGGTVTLTGSGAKFVTDKGSENSLTIRNSTINNNGEISNNYTYTSPELMNTVAYMYTQVLDNVPLPVCCGYFDFNELIAISSLAFCDGEWLEFYSRNIVLENDANFAMNSDALGEFGLLLGDSNINPNGHKLTILDGVTVKSDKQLANLFDAPDGYHLTETVISDGDYHYSYTVVAD